LVEVLGIDTPLFVASELGDFTDDPDERLVEITRHFNGDTYLAGSGGRQYMDLEKYSKQGISVKFQDFQHPEYDQLFGEFEPYMSVIDLILNHGDKSLSIIKGE
jgi:hypothetical protein